MSDAAGADIPQGPYYKLRVARVIDETHDARSIVLEIPDALRERFAYEAGQFLTFRVSVDGHRLVRCYSLASSPAVDAEHKVTVKRVVEGRASNYMNDHIAAGTELEVMHPNGVFCLQDRATPIVLFGGGSGITPVISIVKTALHATDRKLKLVYANRDERSIIFKSELDALERDHPDRLEVVHRLDDRDGFVDAALVGAQIAGLEDADFYICGPGPFMDVVEGTLQQKGVDAERIFIERFESPEAAVEVDPDAVSEDAGVKAVIVLDGETTEIIVGEGETILHAARRAGLEPPFACEEAYCGCCMAKVAEGDVDMLMNDGGIDDSQIADGWVLTCQGIPKSARVKIEYPD